MTLNRANDTAVNMRMMARGFLEVRQLLRTILGGGKPADLPPSPCMRSVLSSFTVALPKGAPWSDRPEASRLRLPSGLGGIGAEI